MDLLANSGQAGIITEASRFSFPGSIGSSQVNEDEFWKLRKQLDQKYAQDVESLERLWTSLNPGKEVPGKTPDPDRFSMKVAKVITNLGKKEFTLPDVSEQIESTSEWKANRSTVWKSLKKLEDAGLIELTSKGKGRRPSIYSLVFEPEELVTRLEKLASSEERVLFEFIQNRVREPRKTDSGGGNKSPKERKDDK